MVRPCEHSANSVAECDEMTLQLTQGQTDGIPLRNGSHSLIARAFTLFSSASSSRRDSVFIVCRGQNPDSTGSASSVRRVTCSSDSTLKSKTLRRWHQGWGGENAWLPLSNAKLTEGPLDFYNHERSYVEANSVKAGSRFDSRSPMSCDSFVISKRLQTDAF